VRAPTEVNCTSWPIIVADANKLTRPIHDRMPVVLDKADVRLWLNGEDRPVSSRVKKTGTGDEDPTLLDEVEA
jgi:putative SOS response-associated peptidase YedK